MRVTRSGAYNPMTRKARIGTIASQFLIMIFLTGCNSQTPDQRKPILLADREAPLGWVYLRVYEDSTFEFESRGLEREGTIYPGKIELIGDTIVFHYRDSIPKAGARAILTKNWVSYFGGKYPESVEIKLNKLK
jgi:hypothetical protein